MCGDFGGPGPPQSPPVSDRWCEHGGCMADRPPSVDALARSLAAGGSTLPHPLLVDVARRAIAGGDVSTAAAEAAAVEQALLRPVINATGVLLHTNLGRAPLAVHRPAAYT